MTPKTYRRKPLEVEAFQFVRYPNGHTSGEEVAAWCGGTFHVFGDTQWVTLAAEDMELDADPGDFIVQDARGYFTVAGADEFIADHEATS